jgi:hypothetical protein
VRTLRRISVERRKYNPGREFEHVQYQRGMILYGKPENEF